MAVIHLPDRNGGDPEDPEATPEPVKLPFVWLRDFGDLHKPEPLRWLLRDRRTGKPFMRAGEAAVLAGDGGVGKGFFWLQVAASIALGRDLFDTFTPEQSDRVVLLVAEDKQNEIHHRLHRIANAMALGADEMAALQEKVGVMPLSGQLVNLLTVDPLTRSPSRTAMFDQLVNQLGEMATAGGFEWSLVGLDPLARFGSANAELDQTAATMFVQALEAMSERLPGKPAIGVTHHSSAASVGSGRSNVRGVTGLRNAFRLAMVLDACETPGGLRGLLLTNDKNNLAPKADRLWLVRLDNEAMPGGGYLETAGVLRRATDDEAKELDAVAGTAPAATREQREQAKELTKSDKFRADCDAVEACLPFAPEHLSRAELLAALAKVGKACAKNTLDVRLAELERTGRIIDLSGGSKATARKYTRPAP
jgi:hypothetical protein